MTNPLDWRQRQILLHLEQSQAVMQATKEQCTTQILEAAEVIATAFAAKNKLMICGNGGSAADSQHLAAEFTSRLTQAFSRPALPALALTTDTSFITAYANDLDFSGIFERQVEALGLTGDVLLGISTSGNSDNVALAMAYARRHDIRTIALTGIGGYRCREHADVLIAIPSDVTQHIQETMLAIEHLICHIVERMLFGDPH